MAPENRHAHRRDDQNRQSTAPDERPFVSVVVPVYEDPEGVETTLSALTDQTYPADSHEIVVVDNGSSDRTPRIVAEYADAHEAIRRVVEPAGGSYTARNAGIRAADGSILAFVDADMWMDPDWLASVVARLETSGVDALACDVELADSPGRQSRADAVADQSLAERYNRRTAFPIREYVEEWAFAPTCCLTVRRSVVADVGGFDDRLVSSGDREFGNRLTDAGHSLAFAPDLTMVHPPRTEVAELVGKAVRIGRGKFQIRQYYPERYGRATTALLSPLSYTPPVPQSMASHVRGWDDCSLGEKVLFALLAWLLTLAKAVGSWREALESRTHTSGGVPATDVDDSRSD